MIENIKPIAFVPESTGIRILTKGDALLAVRTDRITTIAETLPIEKDSIDGEVDCIIDYKQWSALQSEIEKISQKGGYLEVILKNGGVYQLAFMDIKEKFPDIPQLPDNAQMKLLHFKPLAIACLQSHLSNDLRSIYVNQNGAYSTNFLIAAHTEQFKEQEVQLYPADILGDMAGQFQVAHDGESMYIASKEFILRTAQPILEDEENFLLIAEMFKEPIRYVPAKQLPDQLKRISLFDEVITFDKDKIVSKCGSEPSPIYTEQPIEFDVQPLLPILADAEQIGFSSQGHMYIKKGSLTYMASRRDVE